MNAGTTQFTVSREQNWKLGNLVVSRVRQNNKVYHSVVNFRPFMLL